MSQASESSTPQSELRWTTHPPERKPHPRSVTLPCACCCCCCCCLHSLGSLIGGVIGSVKALNLPPKEIDDPNFPFPFRRDEVQEEGAVLPAVALYWLLLSLLLGVGAVWYYLAQGRGRPDELLTGLVIGLALLPLPQLGASILAGLIVFFFYADHRAALARIAKITLYSFVGTVIGVGLLGLSCMFLSVWR